MALVATGKGCHFSGILSENFGAECAKWSSFPQASLLSWWKIAKGWDVLKCKEQHVGCYLGQVCSVLWKQSSGNENLVFIPHICSGALWGLLPRQGSTLPVPLTLVPGCSCGTGDNKDNQLLTSSLLWHTGSAFSYQHPEANSEDSK